MLAGGGIKGGQAVGKTSKDGMTVEERPTTMPDLLATVCKALGIDPEKQNLSNVGRPIRIVDSVASADHGGRGVKTRTHTALRPLPLRRGQRRTLCGLRG